MPMAPAVPQALEAIEPGLGQRVEAIHVETAERRCGTAWRSVAWGRIMAVMARHSAVCMAKRIMKPHGLAMNVRHCHAMPTCAMSCEGAGMGAHGSKLLTAALS